MLTTREAAERLGVSVGRIRQLVGEGRLTAQKTPRGWLLSEESIDQRKATAKPGRPTLGSEGHQLSSYILMQADCPVANVVYSKRQDAFTQVALLDKSCAPYTLSVADDRHAGLLELLNEWWSKRCIPYGRPGLDTFLRVCAVPSGGCLALLGTGASLTDEYWLRPRDSETTWSEVDFRSCGLPQQDSEGSGWLGPWTVKTPDATLPGVLPKRWLEDDEGRVVLVKAGGLDGREALSEVIATRLYRRLLREGDYVEYRLGRWNGELVSACLNFVGEREQFIDAGSLRGAALHPSSKDAYGDYYDICERLGVAGAIDLVEKMIVTDYLLANPSRTWQDFGMVKNDETLRMRPAPLFDAGASLWSRVPQAALLEGGLECAGGPFDTNAVRQLDLVLDARWLHLDALDGFEDEVYGILSRMLPGQSSVVDTVCTALMSRIRTVKEWYAALPHPVPVQWDSAAGGETVEYVTI